ncbi:hypothetical protein HD806DRAFT_160443 [Xylariaceae sp. AK1471]|nr:hypothetical protein HD806DRAFT_160443 [Xylariaceae sp. AK1471]
MASLLHLPRHLTGPVFSAIPPAIALLPAPAFSTFPPPRAPSPITSIPPLLLSPVYSTIPPITHLLLGLDFSAMASTKALPAISLVLVLLSDPARLALQRVEVPTRAFLAIPLIPTLVSDLALQQMEVPTITLLPGLACSGPWGGRVAPPVQDLAMERSEIQEASSIIQHPELYHLK